LQENLRDAFRYVVVLAGCMESNVVCEGGKYQE
jgi:hypothetical protein